MPRYTAAWLTQEHAANVIVLALHRSHLLVKRRTGRRQHSADNDVAYLTFGMAAHDRDYTAGRHSVPVQRGVVIMIYPALLC